MSKDAAWCFDIVEGRHARTACFTRSYSRFVRGTGSILFVPKISGASSTDTTHDAAATDATDAKEDAQDVAAAGNRYVGPDALRSPELRSFGDDWKARVHAGGVLRYFTPREVPGHPTHTAPSRPPPHSQYARTHRHDPALPPTLLHPTLVHVFDMDMFDMDY